MSNGDSQLPWYKDGKEVRALLTQFTTFVVLLVTLIYKTSETDKKVDNSSAQIQNVDKRVEDTAKQTDTNAQKIERMHKEVRNQSLRMGLPPVDSKE